MNDTMSLWQLFALTGDPRQYLKYKERKEETTHMHKKEKNKQP